MELAAVGKSNGFGRIVQGAVVAKGSPLGPVLLDAYRVLFANGTYKASWRSGGSDTTRSASLA